MIEYIKICEHCKSEFVAHRKDKRFCSSKCRDSHHHIMNKENKEYIQKARERANTWYQNNKEYANNRNAQYIKAHTEQRKETVKRYFDTHKAEELSRRDSYLRNNTTYDEYEDYVICHFGGVDTIIDLEDLERIKTQSWHPFNDKYLCFKSYDFKYKLHRFIMQCNDPLLNVHHIDNDQTNNRKINLIVLTHSQHSQLHRYQDKLGRTLSRDEIIAYFNNN